MCNAENYSLVARFIPAPGPGYANDIEWSLTNTARNRLSACLFYPRHYDLIDLRGSTMQADLEVPIDPVCAFDDTFHLSPGEAFTWRDALGGELAEGELVGTAQILLLRPHPPQGPWGSFQCNVQFTVHGSHEIRH